MATDALRLRLEALNRGPLADVAPRENRNVPPVATATSPSSEAGSPCSTKCIPGLLRRGELIETVAGPHWRVAVRLEEFWPGGTRLVMARQQHLQGLRATAQQAVEPTLVMAAEFASLMAALPERAMLLDLETCGLAGSALFLAGVLRHNGDGPAIELLVARNYAEEAAMLASLWQIAATCDVLVTFNGKTFDWPMLCDRSVRHRLDPALTGRQMLHIDILHHARRRWRKQLPNCRLQTLEQYVCRRRRSGDVPSQQIPSIYADYVRTGFERDMDAVLYHNALDLITLLDLTLRLAA